MVVAVRLSAQEAEDLDDRRGWLTRSDYLRTLLVGAREAQPVVSRDLG